LTLVLALRCREGAVLAADDQLTFRAARGRVIDTSRVTKMLHTRGLAWGWGGGENAQQRFAIEMFDERTIAAADRRALVQDEVEDAVRASLAKIEGDTYLDVLMVWWSPDADKALILKVTGLGIVTSRFADDQENVAMIGSDSARKLAKFALRALGFGDFHDVGIEEAKTVAYKIIADVAAYTDDVGRPAYIYGITEHGIEELDMQDVEAIGSSADVWTASLRATLARESLPAPSRTPDTGLRPPQ
jgi:ATP-dependent protease HslVU (ClpYQ) peptidase subunit